MREQDVRHQTDPEVRPHERYPSFDEISAHLRQAEVMRAQEVRHLARRTRKGVGQGVAWFLQRCHLRHTATPAAR